MAGGYRIRPYGVKDKIALCRGAFYMLPCSLALLRFPHKKAQQDVKKEDYHVC